MYSLKKQINLIYILSVLSNLSITGAWVAILASRGFSLVEIGLAETVFHITSLTFEIPSGALADAYGRRNMLIVSNIMFIISNVLTAFSSTIADVCVAFVFNALGYNFMSGSNDALAYDSMKAEGKEAGYEKYYSNMMIIYRVASAVSELAAGAALLIGYRAAYLISVINHAISIPLLLMVREIRVEGDDRVRKFSLRNVFSTTAAYFRDSFRFMKENGRVAAIMFMNSLVGAMDILLLFFLQTKIESTGIGKLWLGVCLFLLQTGGIIGSKLILRFRNTRYLVIFIAAFAGVTAGILLEHTGAAVIMTLGGMIASACDDALQVRTDSLLQEKFPSEQRVTLISILEFTFSVVMIVLSPLAGYLFTVW